MTSGVYALPTDSFGSPETLEAEFEQALDGSPADETELVCLERRRGWADNAGNGRLEPLLTSILVRVVEGRRLGWYRTDMLSSGELERGVRHALALAKVQPKVKRRPLFVADSEEQRPLLRPGTTLRDSEIDDLDVEGAQARIHALCGDGERARLGWSAAQLSVYNSHGLRRSAASTEISLAVSVGDGSGAGWAAGSARTFDALEPRRILERAHAVAPPAGSAGGSLPAAAGPVLLSPEASIELLSVLNGHAFAGRTFLDGTSFLSRHRNVQVFDRAFNLRDDGADEDGMPYPFDLEGAAKLPLELIVDGKPSTPALNRHQGLASGLQPTGQAVGGEDSLFGNLFLRPGTASDEELLAVASDGLRIGWLERPECLDPGALKIRAHARGVRRIRSGRLAEALPDLIWEDSLLRVLARLLAIGSEVVVRAAATTPLGAISAPALVVQEIEGLRPSSNGSA